MTQPPTSRREFVRGTLRWLSAGTVVGVTGLAAWRNARGGCWRPAVCAECPVFSGCDLSRAEEFRRGEGADGGEQKR